MKGKIHVEPTHDIFSDGELMNVMSFEFITDYGLRTSLDRDAAELSLCRNSGSWKAVLILSGSIIEAMLANYLIELDPSRREQILEMTLYSLISQAVEVHLLNEDKRALSTVLKDYRNLIHPGREIRLGMHADRETAEIAVNLLSIIRNAIEKARKQRIGLTAEQLLTKFRTDPDFITVDHLVREMDVTELERLITDLLPVALEEALKQESMDDLPF